ncbi:hypothetical protein [Streptomyces sp. NPDC097610]|uniref:hypothetical protein n=1 Tax=Streptomyces sp. NPDC097610 TaxID=3157227 RepID=UPI003323F467
MVPLEALLAERARERLVEGRAALRAYVGARRHRRHGPGRPPVQIGHYEDTFRRVDGTRLLSTHTVFLPFGGPTPRQRPSAA